MSTAESVPDFGDQPHADFMGGSYDQSAGLLSARMQATRAACEGVGRSDERGELDSRHVRLEVGGFGRPLGLFLADEPLVRDVRAALDVRPVDAKLSHNQIGHLAAANSVNAVRPDFAPDAINDINRLYYCSEVAFLPAAGLARLFVASETINLVNGAFLAAATGQNGRWLQVKELSSGRRTAHWDMVAEGAEILGVPGLQVTLTDFFPPPTGNTPRSRRLRLKSEQYSLFDDLPELPAANRFDAIIATYSFDSVWQPEDVRITRIGDTWYQSSYRVKVDDWSPRQGELLQALRSGAVLQSHRPADYEGMFVEEIMERIDPGQVPYREFLEARPELVGVNVPGGLIKRAAQAIERQLHDNGVFVSMDIAVPNLSHRASAASLVSGVAARFKVEDYALAAEVLRKHHNLDAEVIPLSALVHEFVAEGWERDVPRGEYEAILDPMTVALMVRRRPRYT